MTAEEYKLIQERLRRKLPKAHPYTRREEGYEEGILAAKSIIKEIYEHQTIGGNHYGN